MTLLDNYKVMKVKLNEQSKATHHLFYTRVVTSNASMNDLNSRTLVVNGIPPYYVESLVNAIFSSFGRIEAIKLMPTKQHAINPFKNDTASQEDAKSRCYFKNDDEANEYGFKKAFVLYDQSQSVDKAMNRPLDKEKLVSPSDHSAMRLGFKSWTHEYARRFVSEEKLSREINEFMLTHDETKANKDKEEKEKTNQPDEDGWITVTSKSRKAKKTLTERNIQKLKTKEKKRVEKATLLNFYNFQLKDSKKEYITQLRKKFEEDKKRIDQMKQNRKFKPM